MAKQPMAKQPDKSILPENEPGPVDTAPTPPSGDEADAYSAKKWRTTTEKLLNGEAPVVLDALVSINIMTVADLHRWLAGIGQENARAHLRAMIPDNPHAIERLFCRLVSWCLNNSAVPPNMT